MKRLLLITISVLFIVACKEEKKNFVLQGTIKDLKKGTVYLQRKNDTTLKTLDSILIKGDSNFELTTDLNEPEVLFLRLNKNDDEDGLIRFFADKGTTTVNTSLNQFNFEAKIKGSKQHGILEDYQLMMSKFNNRNLDLIKEMFETRSKSDSIETFNMDAEFQKLTKRKYLYTINFALNNNKSEVAPYLAVAEIPDATTRYLDTIYNGLTENIKISKYGKELKQLISERKDN